jgi:hypothetical protein
MNRTVVFLAGSALVAGLVAAVASTAGTPASAADAADAANAAGASGAAGAAGAVGRGTSDPPGGTPPTYTKTVTGNISVTGNVNGGGGGGGSYDETYNPPACWLQPQYNQPQSWQQGDPQTSGSPQAAPDADSFWWSMALDYPGLEALIEHVPQGVQDVNNDFKMVQHGQNDVPGGQNPVTSSWVWWAPNWLDDAAGWACVQGLLGSANMNNGFLDLEPPQPPDNGTPGQITSGDLAALARAALQLPRVTVHTRPGGQTDTTSAYVNAPTVVYVTYNPGPRPSDTASVRYVGGLYLSATITTSAPQVQITTTDPGAVIDDNDTCSQRAPCKVTFDSPTANGQPYTITATVTWTVSWTTSDGQTGVFTNPPSQVQATRTVIVREIQTVTG